MLMLPERSLGTLDTVHCMDALSLLRGLPDNFVNCVVTSPPYNFRNSTGGGLVRHHNSKFWKGFTDGYANYSDDMPHDAYIDWQRNCVAEMYRIISSKGAIFYNHKWRVQSGLLDRSADKITEGFPVRQIIIWDRGNGFNFNSGYFLPTFEVIYLIAKPGFELTAQANNFKDVWRIAATENKDHPNSFPDELARRCIAAVDAPIVVDPFMGSGTVARVARNLGRHFIGCDISPDYVAAARNKLRRPFEPRHVKQETRFDDLPMFAAAKND